MSPSKHTSHRDSTVAHSNALVNIDLRSEVTCHMKTVMIPANSSGFWPGSVCEKFHQTEKKRAKRPYILSCLAVYHGRISHGQSSNYIRPRDLASTG